MLSVAYFVIPVVTNLCSSEVSGAVDNSKEGGGGTDLVKSEEEESQTEVFIHDDTVYVPTYKPWIVYRKVRVKNVVQLRRFEELPNGKFKRLKNKVKSTLEPRPEKVHSERSLMLKGFHFCFLKWKKADVSDAFLIKRDSEWLVKDRKGRINKFCYQGDIGTIINNASYIYARAGNGRWKKFQNVSDEFRSYVARLPIDNDYAYLNHHRRSWYVMNRLGQYHKLAKRGEVLKQQASAITDQRIWHIFSYEKAYHFLKRHVEKLPTEVNDIKISNLTYLPLGLNDPPLFSHHEHILKSNETPPSDDRLVQEGDEFYMKHGETKAKLEMQGISKGKVSNTSTVFARAADKTWHKFIKVPDKFRKYLTTLPKQYASRIVIYGPRNDSKWYVRDRHGRYKKLVKQGIVYRHEMHAVAEDGKYYHFMHGKLFGHLIEYILKLPLCKTDPYPKLQLDPPRFWENNIATLKYITMPGKH